MIIAKINDRNTLVTDVSDQNGKTITICSSKVESCYLSPRQLVQAALAGCLSMTIRKELAESGIEYEDVVVKVDMIENLFIYDVEIESEEDASVIKEIKNKSVQNCFIRGLLSQGIQIVESKAEESNSSTLDRCCD